MDEDAFRARIYMAAVARCFPGKSAGGGDRRAGAEEGQRRRPYPQGAGAVLKPRPLLPVGAPAPDAGLGKGTQLNGVVRTSRRVTYHGVEMDAICLPHPSGASPWHKVDPGKGLLARAMRLIAQHPEVVALRAA